ncbi:17895_t:CDS:2, partial [Racocetra persica]
METPCLNDIDSNNQPSHGSYNERSNVEDNRSYKHNCCSENRSQINVSAANKKDKPKVWSMKCTKKEGSTEDNNDEIKPERQFEEVMKRIKEDKNKSIKNNEQSGAVMMKNMDEDKKEVEKGKEIREVVSTSSKEVQHMSNKEIEDLPGSNSKR